MGAGRPWAASVLWCVIAAGGITVGCGERPRAPDTAVVFAAVRDSTLATGARTDRARAEPLLSFDPATVRVGDTIGALRVGRVDLARAREDIGYVGSIRFDGEITVSGSRMTHPDFPEVKEICMSVDSATAVRLPRFPKDTRRVWLCFDNRDAAARQLGEAGSTGPLTVVIDHYQTVHQLSDVYDTATLIRVVQEERRR